MEKRFSMIDVAVVAAVLLCLVCLLPNILKPEVEKKRSKVPARQQQPSKSEQEEAQDVEETDDLMDVKTAPATDELEDLKTAPVPETKELEDLKTTPVPETKELEDIKTAPVHETKELEDLKTTPVPETNELEDIMTTPVPETKELEDINTTPVPETKELEDINTTPVPETKELEDINTTPVHETDELEDIKTAPVDETEEPQDVKTAREDEQKQAEELQPIAMTDSNASRNFGDDAINQQSQPRFGGGEVQVSGVPPEEIFTQPIQRIVVNAPFDEQHIIHIRVVNTGSRRIAWATKTNNPARLGTHPVNGVLDASEEIMLAFHCDAFDPITEMITGDRITIVWTNSPDNSSKDFRFEWFQGNGLLRRKNLPIVYNL